jgi:hypothetical protein
VSAILVLAIAVPVVGAIAGAWLPERAVDAVRLSALASAACWFVLLVDSSTVSVSHVHSVPVVAATGCGAALVVAALDEATLKRPALVATALAATSVAVAAGRTATDGGGILVALAVVVALLTAGGRLSIRVWGTAAVGLVVAAIGVVALRSAANAWPLPLANATGNHRSAGVLIVLGAALLVLAGAHRVRGPAALLVPAGAFVAVQASPMVHRTDGLAWLAILLGVAAAGTAAAARLGRPLLDRPPAALTLLALAALAAPGSTHGPALLLAAAGTLAAALGVPAAAALGVPGGVALAIALAARGGATVFMVGLLEGVVALALAAAVLRAAPVRRPQAWIAPVLAVGAWLLVAPGTWAWVGPVSLRAYDIGAARAVAGAAICLVLLVLLGRDPDRWYARAFPPDSPGEDVVRH